MSTYWKVNFTKMDLFPVKYKYSKEECKICITESNHLLNHSPTWGPAHVELGCQTTVPVI